MSISINQNIAISDTGFLFNPSTGESFTINDTGISIIKALKEGLDDAAIISALTDQYNVEEKDAERDLTDFREALKHYHILQ